MKQFYFTLAATEVNPINQRLRCRIKTKYQILLLLLETMRYLLCKKTSVCTAHSLPSICLYVDKMNRLFYFYQKKFFSIALPFTVSESTSSESGLEFSYKGIPIDAQNISSLITIFQALQEKKPQSLEELMHILEEVPATEEYDFFIDITIHLLTVEDGYIRYDHDDSNEHKRHHPTYHFDICYSNAATYKIGLEQELSTNSFIQFLNNSKLRYYLKKKKR